MNARLTAAVGRLLGRLMFRNLMERSLELGSRLNHSSARECSVQTIPQLMIAVGTLSGRLRFRSLMERSLKLD